MKHPVEKLMNVARKKNAFRFAVAGLALSSMILATMVAPRGKGYAVPTVSAAKNAELPIDKVGRDVREKMSFSRSTDETIKVIIQRNGKLTPELNALLNRNGVRVKGHFDQLDVTSAELPVGVVDELASMDEVVSVVVDAPINASGHVNTTTGTESVRAQTTSTGTAYTLNGTGIGIAVIDSGMDAGHKAFLKIGTKTTSRIVYAKDFTGENRTDDPFGHGTHVATAAAGAPVSGTSGSNYEGIADGANLINLRVLNSVGTGTTSGLLNALNWVLTNKARYNIRVVNLSLGTPAINSYLIDPVCIAVRKLVDAGVVVVAAAGNDGKSASGLKLYGGIHSPGNEPSAITVGATNTFGTDVRSDDIVTTYSSRGPTRSYTTDVAGVKHYDNLVKPDLVAPGNKLIFGEANSNLIITTYPNLDAVWSQKPEYRFMYLSGSSMSTPLTAGAAALLLQANPNLRPNMVKMILMYTSQQLPNFNMLEQGAGQLNVEGAVRLAKAIKTNLTSGTALGTAMLTSTAPTPQSTVAGTTFPWAQGIVMDQTYATGTDLITKYQSIYNLGVLLADGTKLSGGVLVSDTTKMTNGVLIGDGVKTSNGVLIGDGTLFMGTGVLLGDGVLVADRSVFGDGVMISDGVLLADGVLIGDHIDSQGVLVNGDNTACMH